VNDTPSRPLQYSIWALLLTVTGCGVFFFLLRPLDWNKALKEAARPADRIVVEPLEGWLDPLPKSVEIAGKERIRALLAKIEIDQEASEYMCGCHGDTLIHFYDGPKHLFSVSHHHGTALRWIDGPWKADGMMTHDSQKAFPKWFAQNGYDGFVRLKTELK
jgi:hypothetical protein